MSSNARAKTRQLLPSDCTCGNPELGFDCVCVWVAAHPGDATFSCIFCGLYAAAEPRCNLCECVS